MKRDNFWLGKWVVGLGCAGLIFSAQAADSLHFLFLGDTGSGLEQQKHVAEGLAHYAEQNRATNPVNFVLFVGDNFYDVGVQTVNDPQWQDKFERMYDAKRLPMPFIVTLGNHDWKGELPDVEIDYARAHPGTRWQMDAHYFKREFPASGADPKAPPLLDLFIIDTEAWNTRSSHVAKYPDKKLGERQMAWLEQQLKASRARWKIVAGHHPLYSDGGHGHESQIQELRARLGPLFKRWQVDAFLTGHDHDLERIEVPGQPTLFLISGAGSKLRPQLYHDWRPFFASTPGFATLTLSDTKMTGKFLNADGKVLDAWERPPLSATTR